ncbi:MAG: SdrD B-like domain-containing protein [Saprospiraceae bacterium]
MTDMDGCVSLSGILSLDLYNGYGQIAGEVYFDVNENGIVDASDTTVSNVNIFLLDSLGIALDSALSNFAGVFSFANIPADGYTLQLDTLALPQGWVAVLASQNEELVGCDDKAETVWLLYKICLPLSSEAELAACAGESAMYNGTAVPAGGSQVFTLQNADGCDSTVTVSVAVLPHTVTPLEEAVCEGSFYEFQGQQIPIGETVIFTEINANGCLDTTIVSVSGLPSSLGSEVFSTCPGDTVSYLGVDLQPGDTEGFTLDNWLGCDSLVTVSVLALPQTTDYVVGEVCDGEFFEFQGVEIPPGQTYIFTETNAAGCIDSIVVDVIKFVSSLDSLGFSACKGEYVTFDGTPVLAGNVEAFSYPAANGCDSVIVVSVDTLPYKVEWVNESACEGAFFEYQGQQIAPGETAIFTETNSFGCKDTTVVSVATLPTSSGSEEFNPCPGETVSYLGTILQHGDVEVFTLQNSLGCDSLVTVTVTELLTDTTYLTYQLCPGETVDYQGFEIAAGETSSFIFTDINGCDSVVSVIAEQLLQAEFGYKVDSACADVADGKVEVIEHFGRCSTVDVRSGWRCISRATFSEMCPGDHVLTVLNDNGCDEEKTLVVPAFPPIDLVAFDETLPCGDSLFLRPDVYSPLPIQWEWFGEDGAVVSNAPELQIKLPGVYSFLVKNECETIGQSIVVHPPTICLGHHLYAEWFFTQQRWQQ